MRYPASEKLEIIRLVERSHLPVKQTLDKLGIPRTTFYRWYGRYQVAGPEALEDQSPQPSPVWNRIPDDVRQRIVDLAMDVPELSPRELAVRFTDTENYFVSEASVYRLLKSLDLITSPAFIVIKAADEFRDKTTAINQLWQTDFTYLKVIGWGWMYLSTILDDYSRHIIAWKLCTTMKTSDGTETLKNRILLENYFFPADLEAQIEAFVDHYNHQRYHESINNLTPADVYFGRGQAILKQRERIKLKTMEPRRLQYRKYAA